jgi:hypothetical protein
MSAVLSQFQYRHPVLDGDGLPSLEAALEPLLKERFRRADRFIQLALLGSASCAAGQAPVPGCGLYLASATGPMGNNIALQEQLVRDRLLPKPFNFINTLGSSAGYYVAKNLGISGPNIFISRREGAWAAALALAETDLAAGIVTQALVGLVEECTLPLAYHRTRLGLGAGAQAAESSDWQLLGLNR